MIVIVRRLNLKHLTLIKLCLLLAALNTRDLAVFNTTSASTIREVSSTKSFKGTIFSSISPIYSQAAKSEVSYPPALPGGISVATVTSDELIKPPSSLQAVAVAETAPIVDFLYYPGQTYKGNPWSNRGDGLAVDGKYYSSIGDNMAPQDNAYIYEYDSKANSLRCIVDVRKVLNLPEGHYIPGKIHGRLDMGVDDWLYFSIHRGSTKVTTDQ